MNRFLLPTTLFLMLLFTFIKSGHAQIAITSADFSSQLQLGEQVSTYLDRTSTQVNAGTQGATSWDFSALIINDEFITESKQHSTSPYAADFPNAMYASNYEGIFEGNYSNTWVYNSANNSFLTHGTGTVANTQAGNIKTVIKYEPAWEQYSFPIQYLDSKTYSGTQYVTTYVTIPGLGEFPNTIEQTVTIEQHVDAYGIVTMPDGKKLNALRLIETSTFNYSGTTSSSTVIRLLTKSGESVSITPANNQSLNGLIQIQNISWTSGDGESIVEETVNAPSNLTASTDNGNVSLSWTDASDNETGFVIERSKNGEAYIELSELAANSTTYTDTETAPGNTYSYRVKAVGESNESGYSNEASITIDEEPEQINAPDNLAANAENENVSLSWTDASDNETGFVIERSKNGEAYIQLAELAANSTTYTDTETSPGNTYSYRVKAVGESNESGYSNEASITIDEEPEQINAPGNLAANAENENVSLSWTDVSDNETGFVVERSLNGEAYIELDELAANSTTYTDTETAPGNSYSYRVKAVGESNESGYSNEASITIDEEPEQINAPGNLAANAENENVSLSWTDVSDNETGFVVERSLNGEAYIELDELAANSTTYTDTETAPGNTYTYRVKAVGENSQSGYSNEASITIDEEPEQINAPGNLAAIAEKENVNLSWTDVSDNETGFVIERSQNGEAYIELSELAANSTTYTDTETAPGNTYAYRVKAVGENSQSEYSNEASITIEQKNGINKISQQHDLAYNYPNPFNSQTTIHFMLNENSDIEFSVYNSTGVLIQRLQGRFNAGDNEFRFDGSNLARGTYQYILQSNTKTSTGKMMID